MGIHLDHLYSLLFLRVEAIFVKPCPVQDTKHNCSQIILTYLLLHLPYQIRLPSRLDQMRSLLLSNCGYTSVRWGCWKLRSQWALLVLYDSILVFHPEPFVFLLVNANQQLSGILHGFRAVPITEEGYCFLILNQV